MFDPALGLVYWNTGNAAPWNCRVREGDNKWTASTIAIDADSGAIKWGYQYTPHDCWDYDAVSTPLLADVVLGDRGPVKALFHHDKNGFFYALDRTNGTPLVVYPLGTENLIAKYLGYKQRPEFVAKLLQSGREVAIDAGQAGEKLFVLLISAGFDAEVVRLVANQRAGHICRWTYAKPLWATLRSYGYPELRIQWEDGEVAAREREAQSRYAAVRWVFGMNLSKYAFGFDFAPRAVGTDGLLDVCTFSEGSFFHTLRYAWGLFSRRHVKYRDTQMIRCRRLRIDGPDGVKVPYQLDGDFGGYLPVEVRMLPGRLRFVVDPLTADRLTTPTHA